MHCGIDPSITGTGLIILDEEFNIVEQILICTKNQKVDYDTEARMRYITDLIESTLLKYKESLKSVYIEGLSFNSKGQSAAQLFGLAYLIRMRLLDNEIYYKELAPTALKKFVTGTGKCQKDLMLLKTFKKFGVEFSDNNLCDAYGLARYGAELYRSNK